MLRCLRSLAKSCGNGINSGTSYSSCDRDMFNVTLALGSNLGDRVHNLRQALALMRQHGIEVASLSRLYESAAAYVTDQPPFLNAAVSATTQMAPMDLLDALKAIEAEIGRDFSTRRYGPRLVDIDIIFYEDDTLDTPRLQIPHPRWQERPFVLAPLSDLRAAEDQPNGDSSASSLQRMMTSAHAAWSHVLQQGPPTLSDLQSVIPLRDSRVWHWEGRTQVMGILNVTPDSFSDGGRFHAASQAVEHAVRLAAEGADIIDVGGQSTRPGADPVAQEEEAARVVPVVKALREVPQLQDVLISVDTFYSSVARQAVESGADMVNDVSRGARDEGMYRQVAELGVPFILMHMRGDPSTMQQPQHTTYHNTVTDIAAEINNAARKAIQAGIEPWRIITDPGIGFAKTFDGNVDIIAGLTLLRSRLEGALRLQPMLVGPSRKGFLGAITGRKDPQDRDVATAATCALCVARGAAIVRTHNVAATRDAVRVADALAEASKRLSRDGNFDPSQPQS